MKNNKWIILLVLLAVALAIAVFFIIRQNGKVKELNELTQQINYEKELLTEEYSDFAIQFEGTEFKIGNDSLIQLLDNEKMKVQSLLEELRAVKATNYQEIQRLKAELASVRKVMMHYVIQIDSLNAANQRLTVENQEIKRQYTEASQVVTSLSRERETLSERISLASMLEAHSITAETLNDRGKSTSRINKIQILKFCFKIGKNITAPVGEKMVYIRIMRPDNNVLVKNPDNLFAYENKQINYSARKMVEYAGEEIDVCMYWEVEEALFPGNYRVDIFADGNLIGSKNFKIEK